MFFLHTYKQIIKWNHMFKQTGAHAELMTVFWLDLKPSEMIRNPLKLKIKIQSKYIAEKTITV